MNHRPFSAEAAARFAGSERYWRAPAPASERDLAWLNYALLCFAAVTLVSAPVAALLAWRGRGRADPVTRTHLDWQLRIFWHGVLAWLAIGLLHAVVVGIAALTFGAGIVFMVVPWGLGVAWVVWTVWALARGITALWRRTAVA